MTDEETTPKTEQDYYREIEEKYKEPEYEEQNKIGEDFDAYYARDIEERNQSHCALYHRFYFVALACLFCLVYWTIGAAFLWMGRFPILRILLWIRRIYYVATFKNMTRWIFGTPVEYEFGT